MLCPGKHTTATLLYKLFHPGEGTLRQVTFSEIMPALKTAVADFGVSIHEGRFTWEQYGLYMVEDLGDAAEYAIDSLGEVDVKGKKEKLKVYGIAPRG